MENRLFLDTNILMEIFFERDKYSKCLEILQTYPQRFISNLSISHLFYFVQKAKLDLNTLEEFILKWKWLEVTNYQIQNSLLIYNQDDFEDAVQISSCLENKISNFVTLDKNLAKKYSDKLNIILL